jgi:hypothetical protein
MLSISALFSTRTMNQILQVGLDVAQAIGLPVSTWREGDPTRSQYHYLAEVLATLDQTNAAYIKAGFLSSAVADAEETGDSTWLKVLALELFGVTVAEATYATSAAGEGVTLTNTAGGLWDVSTGDLTFRNSVTGKTYHNTDAFELSAGLTHTFEVVADEPGSDSTVGDDEIDELVTTLLGVEVTDSDPVVGTDEPSPKAIETLCLATLGALSPNGPPDAYNHVCTNVELTGVTEINRATTIGDNDTGLVTVYVASAAGSVTGASVAAAQAACETWSTPVTVRPTVISAAAVSVAIAAQISGDAIPSTFLDAVEAELARVFVDLPIGGTVYRSRIIAAIHKAVPQAASVSLATPAVDVTLTAAQVPVVGTVAVTEI